MRTNQDGLDGVTEAFENPLHASPTAAAADATGGAASSSQVHVEIDPSSKLQSSEKVSLWSKLTAGISGWLPKKKTKAENSHIIPGAASKTASSPEAAPLNTRGTKSTGGTFSDIANPPQGPSSKPSPHTPAQKKIRWWQTTTAYIWAVKAKDVFMASIPYIMVAAVAGYTAYLFYSMSASVEKLTHDRMSPEQCDRTYGHWPTEDLQEAYDDWLSFKGNAQFVSSYCQILAKAFAPGEFVLGSGSEHFFALDRLKHHIAHAFTIFGVAGGVAFVSILSNIVETWQVRFPANESKLSFSYLTHGLRKLFVTPDGDIMPLQLLSIAIWALVLPLHLSAAQKKLEHADLHYRYSGGSDSLTPTFNGEDSAIAKMHAYPGAGNYVPVFREVFLELNKQMTNISLNLESNGLVANPWFITAFSVMFLISLARFTKWGNSKHTQIEEQKVSIAAMALVQRQREIDAQRLAATRDTESLTRGYTLPAASRV